MLDTGCWKKDAGMSYKNLEVWQLARELVIAIHKLTLEELPKHEMYEVGSQIKKRSIWKRARKKAADKARESEGMRRTFPYAAMTEDEAQRSIRSFYECVNNCMRLSTKSCSFSARNSISSSKP